MLFNASLLSAGDQASLSAAIAAIPAVLTPLSAAITQAQAAGASALSLSAQIATLQAQHNSLVAGGTVSPQGPEIAAIVSQKTALGQNLLVAEQTLGPARQQLFDACHACAGVLSQLRPLAQTQAVITIKGAFAPYFRANSTSLDNAARVNDFTLALNAAFTVPALTPNNLAETVAIASAIQTVLQNIEAGTDFFTLS